MPSPGASSSRPQRPFVRLSRYISPLKGGGDIYLDKQTRRDGKAGREGRPRKTQDFPAVVPSVP